VTLAPCPYHDPKKPDCGHGDRCPLLIYSEYVVCTSLSPMQILAVRTWVEGNVPEKEAGP